MPSDPVRFAPLTPDRLDDFVTLFGPQGACYGCWCTYFRLSPKDRDAFGKDEKRAHMEARIRRGPPPGLLAYLDNEPVGWMQIGPRADVPGWNNPRRATSPLPDAPADDPAVWAISCFFFARGVRGRGLSRDFVAEGIRYARDRGARLLEASPIDEAKHSKSVGLFVGSTSTFRRAGFREVARAKPGRPLMRLVL
ncbi:GNAT family N-acetyltransferase [Defluviimonas salinarum]|uniref:GNAT family N-acetyltransferase n=1 Tax=Defluviimonas salinarum TaxID=2992147 RepID=A0ABT3J4V4_9RHOB|nr:GNAT family N-acetyltransferase [Defluviimonas salinarum]MCW3782712.1 GNAT family N-acetyltransferase [Defluviimonas salinarum]